MSAPEEPVEFVPEVSTLSNDELAVQVDVVMNRALRDSHALTGGLYVPADEQRDEEERAHTARVLSEVFNRLTNRAR